MQHSHSTMPTYHTNEEFSAAIERGERFLSGGYVHGFGVQLSDHGRCIPDAPMNRQEAERVQELIAEQHPTARVVRLGLDADMVVETQEPKPGDYFHISYVCESKPGEWGLHTDLHHYSYPEAVKMAERYRADGRVCVQIERNRGGV